MDDSPLKIIKIDGGYLTDKDMEESWKLFFEEFKKNNPEAKFEDYFYEPVEIVIPIPNLEEMLNEI